MNRRTMQGITVAVLAGIVAWVGTSVVRTPYASTEQLTYNRSIGEITGEREVGQQFESLRPFLSGVGFQIATYGARENTAEVIFELRERLEDPEPLRQVVVNAREFADHQIHVFSFESIPDSAGKTFFASLRSPTSAPGNAITVDYSNENPYHKGTSSALVVLPAARGALASFDGTIKSDADSAFVVVHEMSVREVARLTTIEAARDVWQEFRDDPRGAGATARLVGVSALLAGLLVYARSRIVRSLTSPRVLPVFLGALVLAGFGMRLLFIRELPYTNDEGFYLYDARTVLEGALPGGDALAKAPVVVGAFALGVLGFGPTLTATRLTSAIAGLLTAFPLFVIGRALGGRLAGIAAAILWLLGSTPALFTAYGHTQSVQILLATAGIAAVVWGVTVARTRAFRTPSPKFQVPQIWLWLFLGGLLLGLSVAARKSSLALGLPVVFLLLAQPGSWQERIRQAIIIGAGFVVAVSAFLGFVAVLYGDVGVRYATGLDLAKTSFEQLESRGDVYATYSVKGILPFFRESLPLIVLSLTMVGAGAERVLRRFWQSNLGPRLAWLIPLALAWHGGLFLQRHEEEAHFAYGLWPFWVVMSTALIVLALWPRRTAEAGNRQSAIGNRIRTPVALAVVWFVAFALFYAFWIKFHANYIVEFLPPLVLLSALAANWITTALSPSRLLRVGLFVLITWGAYTATESGLVFAHTGTFHWSSLQEAAAYLKEHARPEDLVLTGATAIPVLSGHHTPYNAAHAAWYGYGFIEPELRNVFMAPAEKMVEALERDVRWVVMERLTAFAYLREYPEIERALETSFMPVTWVENLSNPITIYQRKQ